MVFMAHKPNKTTLAALGIDAYFWMRMQLGYNLKMAKRNKSFY